MATYLYCILNEPRDVPAALTGIDGAPVRSLDVTAPVAWVSDVSEVPVTPTVERLKAHDAVCAAALGAGETPLPVRFGQTFADDGAVVVAIASRRQALAQRLARVAGCVELRVVASRQPATSGSASGEFQEVQSREAPESAEGPGTAFLRERAQSRRDELARERWCEAIRRSIAGAAMACIVDQRPCEARRGLVYFPLLVRRADLDRCRAIIAASLPPAERPLAVLGPFPPYSFAGDA